MPWAGEKSTSGGADLFTALASPRIWSLEGGSSCVFACVCMGMFMCVFVLAFHTQEIISKDRDK